MAPPSVKTPAGDAPVIPIFLIAFGAYLMWFGVKYWRGTGAAMYPSYPIKSVLQGKGAPAPEPAPSTTATLDAYETTLAQEEGTTTGGSGGGTGAEGSAIAARAESYVGKVHYIWGGARPDPGWDCSGMCNWIIGHDFHMDIPGMPRGQVFTGSSHGPDVASWLAWSGCQRVTDHQPGDLVCWGPNEHMGIVVGTNDCVSAADPAEGTHKTTIAGAHGGIPTFLRLRSVTHAQSAKGGDPAQNRKLGQLLAAAFGWSPSQNQGQWDALDKLWTRESGWRTQARNPSSGAYGIPQSLPASKMASVGKDWKTNPKTQIIWGLHDIKTTYGSPEAAWNHEEQFGWY